MKKMITNSSRKIASTNKYKSWIFGILLMLVVGMQSINAQTIPETNSVAVGVAIVPTGWTIINGSTDVSNANGFAGFLSLPWDGSPLPVALPPNGHTVWIDGGVDEEAGTTITGLTSGTTYTFTFYAAELGLPAGGGTYDPNFDGVLRLTSSISTATYPFSGGNSTAWNTFTYTFTANAPTLSISFKYNVIPTSQATLWNVSFGSDAVTVGATCNAGTTAPTLSATTKSNVCPATTVDLTTITASNLPASTTLTWHTATPATTANKIATPSAVAAGTYYAAFFDATNNCYSGTSGNGSATTAVTATVNSCSASSCTVSGVTITVTGSTNSTYFAPTFATNNGCPPSPYAGNGWWTGAGGGGSLTYTFSSPVTSASVRYSIVNGDDIGTISVNGGGTASLSNPCGVTVSGLVISGIGTPSDFGDPSIKVTSTLPFTTLTIDNTSGSSGWVQGNPCDFTFTLPSICNAGTTAPTLSATTKANVCPATTVDLTTITASNLPASTTLTWHTATPATTANKIATPSAVAAGTYYAAFFDATGNCYSGTGGNGSATTVVTATTTTCAALTANNPSTQTVTGGQAFTGNAGTELAPTGGTGPYTYSNGSSDPACINPGGATALPPASNLTVTNSTTGAYTYTAPTAAGTYFFCIKVCDSTTPTPSCVVKTYTVVVPCAAGNNAPVLIKN